MSGIVGLLRLNGAPARREELSAMATRLKRYGPARTSLWWQDACGLGRTLSATTRETPPLRCRLTSSVVTADARLDNRRALIEALGIADPTTSDAGLVLAAYGRWGDACVERLLGDFAFALWDPRERRLLCARDRFGMRPLYVHHAPGRLFAFASSPRALLGLAQIPNRLDEGRVADFLVSPLEGVDEVSTFFEQVERLPPAHLMAVTQAHARRRRYWTLEPGPELRLAKDEDYAEGLCAVLREAVHTRLRSQGHVGSMLSGGMDSGAVVALARECMAASGRGPLATFSAVGTDPVGCVETRSIHAAAKMEGLAPHLIRVDQLDVFMPQLEALTRDLDEPFDYHMTLPRVVYLSARQHGLEVLLDGGAGDVVLAEGSHIARLLRRGHFRRAYREAAGYDRFYGHQLPVWRQLAQAVRWNAVPAVARRLHRRHLLPHLERYRGIHDTLISRDFAERVRLHERLRTLRRAIPGMGPRTPYAVECARALASPFLTCGRERYHRVASAAGVEPRDPFLDMRVVAFCLSLPGEQRLSGGFPKVILRRAMRDRLPDEVRWRRGKEHLGSRFEQALAARVPTLGDPWAHHGLLVPFVDFDKLATATAEDVRSVAVLGEWLYRRQREAATRGLDGRTE